MPTIHFDWTISLGSLLQVGVFLSVMLPIIVWIGKWQAILKNFPFHRHIGPHKIMYPEGMEPKQTWIKNL